RNPRRGRAAPRTGRRRRSGPGARSALPVRRNGQRRHVCLNRSTGITVQSGVSAKPHLRRLMRPRFLLTGLAVVSLAVVALVAALPASAAIPVFKGTVGPGFTISMAKKPTKPGKIMLVVSDKSSIHDFHLTGPGVNVKTSVSGTGTKTFTITLKKGTYKFVCDPHKSIMHGSFTIK